MIVNLYRIKIYPDGGATYGIKGVRGSFSVKPSLLIKGVTPPETLQLEAPDGVFVPEGSEAVAAVGRVVDPARAEKILKAAEVAQERVKKAQERAQKAQERAAKLGAAPEGGQALTEDTVSEPVAQ